MTITRTNPADVTTPPEESSYAQVVTATGAKHVYVSGTVSKNPDGMLMYAGDMERQTRHTLRKVETSLEAVGADMSDVVRRRIFVRDVDWFIDSGAIEVLGEFWSGQEACASTLVEVDGLADQHHGGLAEGVDHADPEDLRYLIEIDVTAVVEE